MTEKSAAALHELVGTCRQRLEDDLCELMEELGPALIEEAAALAATSDDEARRSSYLDLRRSLGDRWQALTPALRQALARA